MIDIEKYWVPESAILKSPNNELSFWEDMNNDGWWLAECRGNLFGFYSHIWHRKEPNHTFLLQTGEDDFIDFYIIPDKLQFFVKLWLLKNIPYNETKRDCINHKYQYQLEMGWFDDPHICKGTPCSKCVKNYKKICIRLKIEKKSWRTENFLSYKIPEGHSDEI